MNTHHLKTLPPYFDAVISGSKTFEVRKNDRAFKQGDCVVLAEYHQGAYTGRQAVFSIGYVLHDFVGLAENYVCFSLCDPKEDLRGCDA